jgi:hypothetical protein
MTVEEAYKLGQKKGREEVIEELLKLLGLDEKIADAVARHEEQYHEDT